MYANIIIILINQLGFFFYLGKSNKKADYYYLTFKYLVYAFSCYLVCGYAGVLFYLICSSNIIYQLFKLKSFLLLKLLLTIGIIALYIYECDYTFINNIPFIVAISMMWIKPYVKFIKKEYVEFIEKVLIIIYAYQFKLYMLALYELYLLAFKTVIKFFSKYLNFVNKRI